MLLTEMYDLELGLHIRGQHIKPAKLVLYTFFFFARKIQGGSIAVFMSKLSKLGKYG